MNDKDLKTPSASPTNVGNFGGGRDVFKTTNSAGNSSFSDRANGLNRVQLNQISEKHGFSSVPSSASKPSDLGGLSSGLRNFGNHVIPRGSYNGPTNLRDVGVAIRRNVTDVVDYGTRPLRAGAGAYYGGLRDLATGIVTDKTTAEAANDLASLPASPANTELRSLGVQPGAKSAGGVDFVGRNESGQDIFRTDGRFGEQSFSDTNGLAPDQKASAATLDKSGDPYKLRNVVDSQFFKGPEGLDRRQEAALDPRVRAAREAAMARGDYKAAQRSLMSESELEQVKFRERMEKGRQAAYDRDPVAAYAIDQDSLVAAGKRAAEADNSNYRRQRDKVDDGYRHDDSIVKRNLAISKIISDMEMANQFPKDATLQQKWEMAQELYNSNSNAIQGGDGGSGANEAKTYVNSFIY